MPGSAASVFVGGDDHDEVSLVEPVQAGRAINREPGVAAQRSWLTSNHRELVWRQSVRHSPDMYRADACRAPDNYAEFLFRSPMALRREPRAGSTPPRTNPTRSL